jgi:phosphate transport system protein
MAWVPLQTGHDGGVALEDRGPLRSRYHHTLDELTIDLADLADRVVDAVRRATLAFVEGEHEQAAEIRRMLVDIDQRTLGLDLTCNSLLALQQPVATDLRTILAVLRLATSIERSARLASHIADVGSRIDGELLPEPVREAARVLGERTVTLYGLAVTAYRTRDMDLARSVEPADDRVDDSVRAYRTALRDAFEGRPANVDLLVDLGGIGRHYERIADHAVKFATQTLYLIEGVQPPPSST